MNEKINFEGYRLSLDLTVTMYQWPKVMGFYPILSDIHCKSLYIHCVQCFDKLWQQIYLKTDKHTPGQFHALAFMHIFICIVTLAVRWPGKILSICPRLWFAMITIKAHKSTLAFLLMLLCCFFWPPQGQTIFLLRWSKPLQTSTASLVLAVLDINVCFRRR